MYLLLAPCTPCTLPSPLPPPPIVLSPQGTLSLNAAIFAAVLLASRLESNEKVFGLVLFALELFAFFPLARYGGQYPAGGSGPLNAVRRICQSSACSTSQIVRRASHALRLEARGWATHAQAQVRLAASASARSR